MSRRRSSWIVVLLVGVAAGAGCARDDGRTLRPPPPGATTPPPTGGEQAGTVGSVGSTPTFALTSPAFANGAALPVEFTCDGAGAPPPVEWSDPPSLAVELALVVTDTDEDDSVRWIVAGLPPVATQLDTNALPSGAVDLGYEPPCPNPGTEAHVYVFTLYALPSPLGLEAGATSADAIARIESSPAQAAQLTAFYGR
ncbi:MAG: YbhB/YbcL family Raf kinase inhibitor-like protein [Acidimicrobiales bacterium]